MSTSIDANGVPQVFCSHRSVDKPRVRAVARLLREAGIDAWFDEWEIAPGENFVAAINKALTSCDAVLVFFSSQTSEGKWVQAEIAGAMDLAVVDGKPLIPILLDAEVILPPLLRGLHHVGIDQIDELITFLNGGSTKPILQPASTAGQRRRFTIYLRRGSEGEVLARAEANGAPVAEERRVYAGAGYGSLFEKFLGPSSRGQSAQAYRLERDRLLKELGEAVGQLLFDGDIDTRLAEHLKKAQDTNAVVELVVVSEAREWLSIPFEAARLANGVVPALEHGVRMVRQLAGVTPEKTVPLAGPLRILVAVGAPDEGNTPNGVLDNERELQSILDAVEKARKLGNAYVRVLNVGSLEEIGKALAEQAYHVLHLSGHGTANSIELEDEDGQAEEVSAEDLAGVIRESGHQAPLVVLSSCLSGAAGSNTVGLAEGLLQHGIPAVVAMQTSVTDVHATRLGAALYDNLSNRDRPLASDALALARQQVESERRKALAQGSEQAAEYATPTLFLSGKEVPLLDRGLELKRPTEPPRPMSSGVLPLLSIGDLVGRRKELRNVLRVLAPESSSGQSQAGCQLLGMGGAGKSAIAGRVLTRLGEAGWICVAIGGELTLAGLMSAIHTRFLLAGRAEFKQICDVLGQSLSDDVRLNVIATLLAEYPLLLILDNFEDNLTRGGADYLSPGTSSIMNTLYASAQLGKLLVTCRYPLPGADGLLVEIPVGPLSPAQTRKLMLRLNALQGRDPEDLRVIQEAIGGHPRMLEYLDAILRQGDARMRDVGLRLREQAKTAEAGSQLKTMQTSRSDRCVSKERPRWELGIFCSTNLLTLVAKEPGRSGDTAAGVCVFHAGESGWAGVIVWQPRRERLKSLAIGWSVLRGRLCLSVRRTTRCGCTAGPQKRCGSEWPGSCIRSIVFAGARTLPLASATRLSRARRSGSSWRQSRLIWRAGRAKACFGSSIAMGKRSMCSRRLGSW